MIFKKFLSPYQVVDLVELHLLLRLVGTCSLTWGFPPVCPTGMHLLCRLVELVTSSLDWSDYSQRLVYFLA